MENSTNDPRRMMACGIFKWRAGLRYKPTKDRPNPKVQMYSYEKEGFFIIGEEEEAWEKVINKEMHVNSYVKEVVVEDKRIENIQEMGYSLVDKEGRPIRRS